MQSKLKPKSNLSVKPSVQSVSVKPISEKLLKQISKESSIFIDLLKKKILKLQNLKVLGMIHFLD